MNNSHKARKTTVSIEPTFAKQVNKKEEKDM